MDSLTALLTILIARLFLRPGYALLAGLLYALCVFPIQQAHFFTVDSTATALITLSLFLLCRMANGKNTANGIAAGFIFGLALASRINLLLFLPLIPAAFVFAFFKKRAVAVNTAGLPAALAAGILAFRLFQPYAFVHGIQFSTQWLGDIKNVMNISSGEFDVPFTRQWAGRTPWLFPAANIIRFGMGWLLGLTAWTGLFVFAFRFVRALYRNSASKALAQLTPPAILCLAWVLTVFLYHGHTFLMTMRYFLPIYPPLIIFAVQLMQQMTDRISLSPRHRIHRLRHLPSSLVIIATLLWALAFSQIYRVPHSRITASRWIIENIPARSTLAVEHWDDALPLPLPQATGRYQHISLPLYDNDTPAKMRQLIDQLNRSDYIILASNRLYDSIPRLPRRYPMTINYYNALFNGTLGFEPVADFPVTPALAGWSLNDQSAEEAFTVYDHPRVQIFRKTDQWNTLNAAELLGQGVEWNQISTLSARDSRNSPAGAPTLSPDTARSLEQSRDWLKGSSSSSGLFNPDTFTNRNPLKTWIILLLLLQLIAFPITYNLLNHLPDRGWLAARFVIAVPLTAVTWLAGRLHAWPITPVSIRLTLTICGVLSLIILLQQRRHMKSFIRRHWKRIALEEGFFWIIFALFLLIRAGNSDLWHPYFGGEKPMDFAFLNATVRSVFYPPYNPWFSGEYVNYYYMGFVFCALWTKAAGIMPALAYNLMVPTLAAITAGLAFTAGSLLSRAFFTKQTNARRIDLAAGFITAGITLLIGNAKQWLLLFKENIPNWDWYWYASRAITTPEGEVPPITEFPFFTFLYGDLHAHMIGFPFLLLTLVLCIAIIHRRQLTVGLFTLLTLNTALSYTVNAWDYPVQIACCTAAFLLTGYRNRVFRHLLKTGGLTLALIVAGRLITLPFHHDFISGYSRFIYWDGPRTPFPDWLMIHGLFLLPILASLPLLIQTLRQIKHNRLFYFWLILLTGALLITAGVECYVLQGDIGRMNTVFKFYLQTWFILALCAGSITALALSSLRTYPKTAIPALTVILLCICTGLLYPLTATHARWKDRFNPEQPFGLNGQTFMQNAQYHWDNHKYALRDDFTAMQWLTDHVTGTPVIIEAHLPEYRWGARYSIHTGLPTPIGWAWHQRQQHAGIPRETVQPRIDDIHNFYGSTSPLIAKRIAEKYNARYFIIGPAERAAYPENGIKKFTHPASHWKPVYSNGQVVVFGLSPSL